MSRTQAWTHLRSLEAKGFITVDSSDRNKGMLIRPDPNWEPIGRKTVREEKAARKSERDRKKAAVASLHGVRMRQRPINRNSAEPDQLERTFRQAFERDRYLWDKMNATCLVWTDRQRDLARDVVRARWQGYPAERCHDLVEWAIREWVNVKAKLNLPMTPDIDALLVNSWALRLEYEWQEANGILPEWED